MKKVFLIAAILAVGVTAYLMAGETVNVPTSLNSNPLDSATYGGVDVATNVFTSAQVFVGSGAFVVDGVIFSSGPATDFVSFSDTSSSQGTPQETFRIYLASNSNSGSTSGAIQCLPYPARFTTGLSFKVSDAGLNSVAILYYRRRK